MKLYDLLESIGHDQTVCLNSASRAESPELFSGKLEDCPYFRRDTEDPKVSAAEVIYVGTRDGAIEIDIIEK